MTTEYDFNVYLVCPETGKLQFIGTRTSRESAENRATSKDVCDPSSSLRKTYSWATQVEVWDGKPRSEKGRLLAYAALPDDPDNPDFKLTPNGE